MWSCYICPVSLDGFALMASADQSRWINKSLAEEWLRRDRGGVGWKRQVFVSDWFRAGGDYRDADWSRALDSGDNNKRGILWAIDTSPPHHAPSSSPPYSSCYTYGSNLILEESITHCNDDDDHYRSDAQRDDEKIVVDTRNREVIWEMDEEGVVFKFAAKRVTRERQGQDMC
ncbi:hypothetical protein EYF80_018462 [Liparis tanakae]|uniref:Uncharacterized protein n=1 Tax=Liparis tanakae TaxID=230148 RepID=A0A4Z2I258_9TELE|nr:hypothetical protein EYF80_018462 [Liparis tanakae]